MVNRVLWQKKATTKQALRKEYGICCPAQKPSLRACLRSSVDCAKTRAGCAMENRLPIADAQRDATWTCGTALVDGAAKTQNSGPKALEKSGNEERMLHRRAQPSRNCQRWHISRTVYGTIPAPSRAYPHTSFFVSSSADLILHRRCLHPRNSLIARREKLAKKPNQRYPFVPFAPHKHAFRSRAR